MNICGKLLLELTCDEWTVCDDKRQLRSLRVIKQLWIFHGQRNTVYLFVGCLWNVWPWRCATDRKGVLYSNKTALRSALPVSRRSHIWRYLLSYLFRLIEIKYMGCAPSVCVK